MLKKILIICVACLVIALLFSCDPCKCPKNPNYFNYISFWGNAISYDFTSDTTYNVKNIDTNSIPSETYGISLNYTAELVSINEQKSNNSFFNNLYACKCRVIYPEPDDPISTIVINTNVNYKLD